jgi:outer membrane protein OmpA-like peptidoglycan-associated protein
MLVGTCSAGLFGATLALGSSALLAQEAAGPMWGGGESRLCNIVIDSAGNPVIKNQGVGPVIQNQTFDCPEQIAAVEPAAPPAALPESGTIYFEFDKYDLTPEAQAALNDIVFDIKDRDLGGIVVNGHTDTVGTADYNMWLSQERANTVAKDLIDEGIPAQIVTTKAWGFTDLAVETPPETPLQANRRVVMDFER